MERKIAGSEVKYVIWRYEKRFKTFTDTHNNNNTKQKYMETCCLILFI